LVVPASEQGIYYAKMPSDSSEQSQRASCEPLTAAAEREDIILR